MGTLIDTTAYIEYGILIAVVLSAAELVCIASMNGGKKLNPLAYIVALALCALLTFQMSRLVGACFVNSAVDDVRSVVGMFSQTAADMIGHAAKYTAGEIAWFVFRRCLWSLLFMAVAGFVIYVTMEKPVRRSGERPRVSSPSCARCPVPRARRLPSRRISTPTFRCRTWPKNSSTNT